VPASTLDGLPRSFATSEPAAVKVSEPDRKMGNRLQLTSDVEFTDVYVREEHLIAAPGRGLSEALKSLSLGRIGVGAMGVGMAQSAFDHAVPHMRRRSAFGSKLGTRTRSGDGQSGGQQGRS
jgi:alkylation response protein AidB-like acyl-CoA dehydrogenase